MTKKITLRKKDGSKQTFDAKEVDISQKTIVVLDGIFYIYAGTFGKFFEEINFAEVDEPVYLDKQT